MQVGFFKSSAYIWIKCYIHLLNKRDCCVFASSKADRLREADSKILFSP